MLFLVMMLIFYELARTVVRSLVASALMIAHTLMVITMSEWDGTWENDPLDMRCIRLDAEMEALSEARNKGKPKPRRLPRFFEPGTLSQLTQHCHEGDDWDFYCGYRKIPKDQLTTWKYQACDIIRKTDGIIVDNTCSSVNQAKQRIIDEHNGRFEDYDIYAVSSWPEAKIEKVEL